MLYPWSDPSIIEWLIFANYAHVLDERLASMIKDTIIPVIHKMHRMSSLASILRIPILSIENDENFTLVFQDLHGAEKFLLSIRKKYVI